MSQVNQNRKFGKGFQFGSKLPTGTKKEYVYHIKDEPFFTRFLFSLEKGRYL